MRLDALIARSAVVLRFLPNRTSAAMRRKV